jgi:hypothetical protein
MIFQPCFTLETACWIRQPTLHVGRLGRKVAYLSGPLIPCLRQDYLRFLS